MRTPLLHALLTFFLLACSGAQVQVDGVVPVEKEPSPVKPEIRLQNAAVDGPVLRILGIAQDGGLPHAACSCARCDAARMDPTRGSFVASLGILLPKTKQAFLVDATPDIIDQLNLLTHGFAPKSDGVDRAPVDGVFLTHAHMGHYLGLAHFGFEAVSTRELPVWCSPKMASFLEKNAPWDRLVSQEHLALHPTDDAQPVSIGDKVRVTPISVPHRAEYTDTYGYYIQGPRRRALYIPDTAPWGTWEKDVEAAFDGVDIALIDGTFFSGDELPGRDISQIGHPLMVDSMDLLQSRVDAGTLEVYFIHLNHSNPALDPQSQARKTVDARGFRIGQAGVDIGL